MLHFADALKNVTGEDLYREFPKRLERPLKWFRYHLAPPEVIEDRLYYPENANVISGSQLDACSVTPAAGWRRRRATPVCGRSR